MLSGVNHCSQTHAAATSGWPAPSLTTSASLSAASHCLGFSEVSVQEDCLTIASSADDEDSGFVQEPFFHCIHAPSLSSPFSCQSPLSLQFELQSCHPLLSQPSYRRGLRLLHLLSRPSRRL